ncbi:hypothetical protein PGT21_036510 [Puccinia graminis f. sp. tritici]|nr:hypothetical protein PGT21_036510 [Puccinia graminis f. sp. tritici]
METSLSEGSFDSILASFYQSAEKFSGEIPKHIEENYRAMGPIRKQAAGPQGSSSSFPINHNKALAARVSTPSNNQVVTFNNAGSAARVNPATSKAGNPASLSSALIIPGGITSDLGLKAHVAQFEEKIRSIQFLARGNGIRLRNLPIMMFFGFHHPTMTICKASVSGGQQPVEVLSLLFRELLGSMWSLQVEELNSLRSQSFDHVIELKKLFDWLCIQIFSPEEGIPIVGFLKSHTGSRRNYNFQTLKHRPIQSQLLKYFSEDLLSEMPLASDLAPVLMEKYWNDMEAKNAFRNLEREVYTGNEFERRVQVLAMVAEEVYSKNKAKSVENSLWDPFLLAIHELPNIENYGFDVKNLNLPIAIFTIDGSNYVNVLRPPSDGPVPISKFHGLMSDLVKHLYIFNKKISKELFGSKHHILRIEHILHWLQQAVFNPKSGVPIVGQIKNVNSILKFKGFTPLDLFLIKFISYQEDGITELARTTAEIMTSYLKENDPEAYDKILSLESKHHKKLGKTFRNIFSS